MLKVLSMTHSVPRLACGVAVVVATALFVGTPRAAAAQGSVGARPGTYAPDAQTARSAPAAPDTASASAPAAPAAPQQPRSGGAPPSKDAFLMGSPPALPAGMTEQQMWPAATEEGWAKPVLVHWQRSFDDALRVARATHKPILVAVNMDGEIASEHFAGVRYRDPETARALEPYVCIVASVYRHTTRDYDAQGRRVLCPRFGSVTCGEHIAAETELYEKYFEGMRVSPRHIVLEPDGSETFDVYFSWDTATVLTTFRKAAEGRPAPLALERPEATLADRVAIPDSQLRDALESEYQNGDAVTRRARLEAILVQRDVNHVDLLRLAIFGFDLELARLARRALAQSTTEGAVDLVAEALKVPLDPGERDMLLAAAARLAEQHPRARTLVALHDGLRQSSKLIDAAAAAPEREYEQQARAQRSSEYRDGLDARTTRAERGAVDVESQLEIAETQLARALHPTAESKFTALLVEDARRALLAARELGASGWRYEALLAVSFALSGDSTQASEHAEKAVEGGMLLDAAKAPQFVFEATGAQVLVLFAQARQAKIRAAYRAGETWPPEWMSDINAAYALLAKQARTTEAQLVSFYDFLRWIGATPRADAMLDDALARYPSSPLLHERYRAKLLWDGGPEGLESAYAQRLAAHADVPDLLWFAGYASLVAAEHARRRGDTAAAEASYQHGIERYESYIAKLPENRASADHYVALAFAARARLALERGDLARSVDELVAALARAPASGATPDGLNITPVDTAKMLRERLETAKQAELLARVQAALAALDPKLLEKRAFELEDPRARARPNRR